MASFTNFFKKHSKTSEIYNDGQSNNIEDIIASLKRSGYTLWKVKSKNSIYKRTYFIDDEGLVIQYHGSQKSQCISNLLHASTLDDNVLISHIDEIRDGSNSDLLKKFCSRSTIKDIENRCFSIIYDGKTLDLIAETEQDKINFTRGIKYLINNTSKKDTSAIWIKELFLSADLNSDKKLSVKEVVKLLNNLNIEMDEFNVMMFLNKEFLDIEDFVTFILRILRRKEVISIFRKYSGDKMYIIPEELQAFFLNEQKEDFDIKKCIEIIQSHEPVIEMKEKKSLSVDGFHSILTSDLMDILDPKCQNVYQDMTYPISHYFIDSSHNTYLEGKQYNSKSKLEAYIKALKSGCRCVELDVWDGQKEPEIFHGYANTSSLLFSDVIKTIDKYAFGASKYPVILSIENHCSLEMQHKMAEILRNVFKDKLYTATFRESDRCPTPEELIGKIIIKGKKKKVPTATLR